MGANDHANDNANNNANNNTKIEVYAKVKKADGTIVDLGKINKKNGLLTKIRRWFKWQM